MWYSTFDSVFWLSVGSIVIGFLGIVIKYCLKSKCENVNCCCGLISVRRNVQLEHDEEITAMEMGINRDINRNANIVQTQE